MAMPLKKRNDWRQSNSFIPEEIRNYAKSIHLVESNRSPSYFYCPFCKVEVEPTKSFLDKHVNDVKHRKKTTIYQSEKGQQQQATQSIETVEQSTLVDVPYQHESGTTVSPSAILNNNNHSSGSVYISLQDNCYCFFCGSQYYRQPSTTKDLDLPPNFYLQPQEHSVVSSYETFTDILEPPWLSPVLKKKLSSKKSICHCLSEELKLFERYFSFHPTEESRRRQVVLFIRDKLEKMAMTSNSVVVLDDIAISYNLYFDSILLSWNVPYWNSAMEEQLRLSLEQNTNHWQFCQLSRTAQGGDIPVLWIIEQRLGVSIQIWILTSHLQYLSRESAVWSVAVWNDPDLRCILLFMKYWVYWRLNVCHFSDIYVFWLLLHYKRVCGSLFPKKRKKNNDCQEDKQQEEEEEEEEEEETGRGYIFLQLLHLLGQVISHIACAYPIDRRLFSFSKNEKYFKDIYAQLGEMCRQAYSFFSSSNNNSAGVQDMYSSSPLATILPWNRHFLSMEAHKKNN
ncbi:hypothetical protein GAYE_FCTG49G0019 [Galdieria yellowstonensis]|uniref:U1-type domain-containing protein n=1 Tax=Galdieria yellowstonensis TaxID=3028027 RepID=A0AAV9I7S6_9RHOD|nr:hypothetical protein GAYE_FCTG49G0019 [Galdieria yellowstonensis]